MSSSCRAASGLPMLLVLVPLLLMLVSSVQCQDIIGALIINKVERCIDKLNAIIDFIGLVGGGTGVVG